MVKTPLSKLPKPIEEMTPLELENYRVLLKQETARINTRLKELLEERKKPEGKNRRPGEKPA